MANNSISVDLNKLVIENETFDESKVKSAPFKPGPDEVLLNSATTSVINLRPREPFDVRAGRDTERFKVTARNPVVKGALDNIIIGTFWSDWSIRAVNDYEKYPEYEALDVEIIDSIERQIAHMAQYETFEASLKGLLENALVYGFAVAEKTFQRVEDEMWLVAIKTEPSFLFDFDVLANGQLGRVEYNGDIQVTLVGNQIQKLVIAPYPYLKNKNWYGQSEMQSLFHDVELLELMEQAEAEGGRLLAVRPILYWYQATGRSDAEVDEVMQALVAMDAGSITKIPVDANVEGKYELEKDTVEVLEDRASAEGVKQIQDIIDRLQKRITRTLGVPDDLGFTSTGAGSFAKAKEEMDMFLARAIRNQQFIEDTVNRSVLPQMVRFNYSTLPTDYRLPEMNFESLEEQFIASQAQVIIDLIGAGVIAADEPWIRDILNIPQNPTAPATSEADVAPTPDKALDV